MEPEVNLEGAHCDSAMVTRSIEEGGVKRVLVGGCDINGGFRGKFVPAWRFGKHPDEPQHFADVFTVMDLEDAIIPRPEGHEGWWPTWEVGFGDLEAHPDLDTYRVIPWLQDAALVLADFHGLDGNPLEAMPRNVLRRVEAQVIGHGFRPVMAPELEFMLFRESQESAAEKDYRNLAPIAARPSAYGASRAATDLPVVARIEEGIEAMGIPIEAVMAEAGPGQYELNLTPRPALEAADQAFLFKVAVKHLAEAQGFMASFMPKLAPGGFGSSFHVHQSLWSDTGNNLFADPTDPDGLSIVARQYIAGLKATMREFTALFAPFINSYKRFEPEAAVGTTVSWSIQSKAVSIRAVNAPGNACRVEHRSPGSDANPYLALAAMLAGGLHGIENDLDPGAAYSGNAYSDPSLEVLPRTLGDAVTMLEQSEVANRYLGEAAVTFYCATRRWEMELFNSAVTDWEFRRYFGVV